MLLRCIPDHAVLGNVDRREEIMAENNDVRSGREVIAGALNTFKFYLFFKM